MQYFRIHAPTVEKITADGSYKWKLRPVRCPVCNRYRSTWTGLPTLTLPEGLDESLYTLRSPVPKSEFDALVEPLKALAPPSTRFLPGMGFGQFRGTVGHKEKKDFAWSMFKIFPKEEAYARLADVGIRLPTAPAIMEDLKTGEINEQYRRIVMVKPVECMAVQSLDFAESANCIGCGTRIKKRPTKLFLKKKKVPTEEIIFAVEETDQLVANEDFRNAVKTLKLSNVAFDPVELM